MPARSRPRMTDLARTLGVSQASVSNAFNRPDQLSRDLRERILDAAREMGYAGPDPLANTFRRGRTGAVGLIVHEPLQYLFEDAAARLIMTGLATACGEHRTSLVLVPRAEPAGADVVSTALVDGFVAFCDPLEPERRELIRTRGLPVIGLDAPIGPGGPYVGIDDRGAARAAAAHVAALGHRRVGVVAFPLRRGDPPGLAPAGLDARTDYVANRARLLGYRDGLAQAVDPDRSVMVVVAAGVEEAHGAAAAALLLDRPDPPTAVLAMSDRLAVGVVAAARSRDIAVPADLSVVGFDDVPDAARAVPPLTTLAQPLAEKGARALHMLLAEDAAPGAQLLPTRLVVRSTTAPPRG